MSDRAATTANGTIAWVFKNAEAAEAGVRRLRTAGFADVRVSESEGSTADAHVAPAAGLTESDFAARLEAAGFASHDARALTDAVAKHGSLVTIAAGDRVERALAVLRGETVVAEPVAPVDFARSPVATAPIESAPVATAPVERAPVEAASGTTAPFGAVPDPHDERDFADGRTMELRAERLTVDTHRETSEARIRKETITENRTIVVPVRREELVVERDGEPTVRIPISDDAP